MGNPFPKQKIFFFLFLFAFVCIFPIKVFSEEKITIAPNAFAIVELYTSQGCSSCPPADQMLNRLTQLAKEGDKPIYTLAFHVDYWDYLGWKDLYSHSTYTQRQRDYARWHGKRNIYTPQMIVNGTKEFSGYNNVKAAEAINQSLVRPANVLIDVNLRMADDTITVQYKVSDVKDNSTLNIAIVESGREDYIPRGENAGKTLKHDHVVRGFGTYRDYDREGWMTFQIPEDLDPGQAEVIVFVQDLKTLEMIGATQKIWQ